MIVGGGILLVLACESGEKPGTEDMDRRHTGTQPATSPALTILEDVTDAAGIDFTHDKHETGRFHYPEIFGSGVGVLDYDNDGWYDLYFVQGGKMPGVEGGRVLSDQLYRNRRDGTFENVTERAGVRSTGYGRGAVCGDYDNDGDTDVYVYNVGPDVMLRNNGDGTFTDVTRSLGLGSPRWGDGAAFFDCDADGWLDLFVVNYVIWDPATEPECTLEATSDRDYCGPLHFRPEPDALYHNRAGNSFVEVGARNGLAGLPGAGMGVGIADFDGDGTQDVYVGNDAQANRLLRQGQDGRFLDVASETLCDLNIDGMPQSSMGITVEDFDLDGSFDLLLGHFRDDPNTLYLKQGSLFRDVSRPSGLHVNTRRITTFAISVLDLFNDGRMQLLFGNGRAHKNTKVVTGGGDPYAERDLLLEWSYPERRFTDITDQAGPALEATFTTRGSAVIDFDNDGDMDVVLAHNGGPARLLRCNAPAGSHWLMVRCLGPDGKRDAYGAVVEVEAGGRTRRRQVYTACSYGSSCDPRVHFGLGEHPVVDRLTVYWVGGERSTWTGLSADQLFIARHADDRARLAGRPGAGR